MKRVHFTGAFLAFGNGVLYLCIETYISFKMAPIIDTLKTAYVRLFLTVVSAIAFILSILSDE